MRRHGVRPLRAAPRLIAAAAALTLATLPGSAAGVWQAPDEPDCPDPSLCDPFISITPMLEPKPDSIACVAGPQPRLQAVVAYPQQLSPPGPALENELRQAVRLMGEAVRQRSVALGSVQVRLRVECDRRGIVTVLRLPVPPDVAATINLGTLDPLVRQHPAAAPNEKYLVYYDAPSPVVFVNGQASFSNDAQPGSANVNNRPGTVAVQYQSPPRAYQRPHWRVLLHEYLHTLGAVQRNAPHTDNGSHQTQSWDVMGGDLRRTLPPECATFTVDCGADDYFHPTPPPGSYLADNWNIAGPANGWIERSPARSRRG